VAKLLSHIEDARCLKVNIHDKTLRYHRAEMRQNAGLTGKKVQCTEFQIEESEREIPKRNLGGDKSIILK